MAKRRSRFWVVRSQYPADAGCPATVCAYRIYSNKPFLAALGSGGWSGKFVMGISSRAFHRLSDICLKPGGGPVELKCPLFEKR